MKRKRRTIIFMVTFLIVVIAGCSQALSKERRNNNIKVDESDNKPDINTSATQADKEENSKILVVYYSASGNTKRIAEMIADVTNGDLFELVPKNPYTNEDLDYSDPDSRIIRERENIEERTVELTETTVENWNSYDTVLIGYPIWYGVAAWPVNSFVESNDFSGKTVIPFCTSSSSELGDSGQLLEELTDGGEWQDGRRFSSNASKEEIQDWLSKIGMIK